MHALIPMDSKARALLALRAIFTAIKAAQTTTVTPDYVLTRLLMVESAYPETMLETVFSRREFYHACTLGELQWLVEEYRRERFVLEEQEAMAELARRQVTP